MTDKALIKEARKFAEPFRVTKGDKFRLKHFDPRETQGLESDAKPRAQKALAAGVKVLAEMQEMLYAQDRWAVLVVLQAMDAAGKDGAIKHVMSGVNPQGCDVHSFKAPSSEDLDHDYLWRCMRCLPNRGHIGIFNRSYYEEVLVVRVHPELLEQKIPSKLVTKSIWDERFEDIRHFESYLARNGIVTVKIFLNLSKDEQKKRFLERADNPEKNWKFSTSDVAEREYWDEYQSAFEDMICNTATKRCPWYVIPADRKWFSRLVVGAAVIDTLASLDLAFPVVSKEKRQKILEAKEALLHEH